MIRHQTEIITARLVFVCMLLKIEIPLTLNISFMSVVAVLTISLQHELRHML